MPTEDSSIAIDRSGAFPQPQETTSELGLTRREGEILGWVAHGKTNGEIAAILWVAPSTVRKHLENVYAKLGVHTRTAAVMRFLGVR